jgi:hypothetical protein
MAPEALVFSDIESSEGKLKVSSAALILIVFKQHNS